MAAIYRGLATRRATGLPGWVTHMWHIKRKMTERTHYFGKFTVIVDPKCVTFALRLLLSARLVSPRLAVNLAVRSLPWPVGG